MNMMTTTVSRYEGLDILKTICAFLIVCIHAPFPNTAGGYITALARIAVPIFFMITGFFYDRISSNRCETKQIKKIFILFIYGNLLYFAYRIGISVIRGNIGEYFESTFTFKNLIKFLVFNESMFYGHLWYLGAILYVLAIVWVLKKFFSKWQRVLYIISPFLLVGDLVLGKYSLLLLGKELPSFVLVRNFLFVGIPYFTIGYFLKERSVYSIKNKRIICSLLSVLFVITTLLERYILISLDANAVRDHYISSTLLAVVVFIIFTDESWNNNKLCLLKVIGKDYSTWVYIIHPLVIILLSAVISKLHFAVTVYGYLRPVIVYITTVVVVAVCCKIKNAVIYYFKKSRAVTERESKT